MSVIRQQNWLGQGRADVPHLRSIESGVAGDFDLLAGRILAGNRAQIVSGFTVVSAGSVVGLAATALQINVTNGILLHPLASETGTLFSVPADRTTETLATTNSRVSGSWASGAINYVGIDLRRSADSSTSDLVMFLDANSLSEVAKTVPLARTLDYKIIISSMDFSAAPSVAPVARVTLDAGGNVTAIIDARQMMFRLGSGGGSANIKNTYSWPVGRAENTGSTTDLFAGGDKSIGSLKTWADAVMTRLWELGGGDYWYSPTADRNVKMVRSGAMFAGGEYFEWTGSNLHWKGLKFIFDNSGTVASPVTYNDVADQTTTVVAGYGTTATDLADGDCIYVDIDRTANRTGGTALLGIKAQMAALGTPTVPGSRYILAWRVGSNIYTRDNWFAVGTAFAVATNSSIGVVKLNAVSSTPSAPVVSVVDNNGFVAAMGLSRDNTGGTALAAGSVTVGGGANDSSVAIGKAATTSTIKGTLAVDTVAANLATHITVQTSAVIQASASFQTAITAVGNGAGSAGVFLGGSTGYGVEILGASGNDSQQLVTRNEDGTVRSGFDHIGFPAAAPGVQFRENWIKYGRDLSLTSETGDTTLWPGAPWCTYSTLPGTGVIEAALISSTFPIPTASITLGSTINDNGWLSTGYSDVRTSMSNGDTSGGLFRTQAVIPIAGSPYIEVVMEWVAALTAVGANDTTYNMGFTHVGAAEFAASPSDYFQFRKASADTNWQTVTASSTGPSSNSHDSLTAPTANTFQRFRIEYSSAGTGKVRYFIDDVLVDQVTGTTYIPTAKTMRISFGGTRTAGSITNKLIIGPIYCCVNTW